MEPGNAATTRAGTLHDKGSLLLVDDHEHVRDAVKLVLEGCGYSVTECADAQEALELLHGGQRPDLIVLDLEMPRMDGWQFRVAQKQTEAWAQIPVLALSADRSAQAMAMDADCYLHKPVDRQALLETVARLIHMGRHRRGTWAEPRHTTMGGLGNQANEEAWDVTRSLGATLANLQLAQTKAEELESRLAGAEAFSMVGIRQLLTRAQRGAERIAGLSHGTAALAALASRRDVSSRPRLLVIDPDPVQLVRIRSWLQDDFEVETATSSSDALARLQTGQPVDTLLCALTGPTFDGMELYESLASARPDLVSRVVFMTEGPFDERLRRFLAGARRPQVRRPHKPSQLRQLLQGQLRATISHTDQRPRRASPTRAPSAGQRVQHPTT